MTFGEKFKAEREKRNLTQQEVADGLGLHRRMITRYEHGLSLPRTKDAYKKIADFFGVSVNYLLTEDEEFVVEAVSYTHLDVYKRQHPPFPTCRCSQRKDGHKWLSGIFAAEQLQQ